ncbi:hypothetical protein OQH61_04240 [Helicobacter sp. MIT 21-1697]|uniref:NfeD family protein n=1 Tax=Helicobacter sp. MIT 21-1697 TaxID=2993733 RepID=UPI00224B356D|nr:hypothetical protein [Helicobacter sp. MIT 21-1697]MCX2716941.1 hypothetical protein [Helicobacter sp. MIT 21-1697]
MSALLLLGMGIAVIIAEIFFGSFFLLFVGIGLLITAGIESIVGFQTFGNPFVWQSLSICAFSLISLMALRKPIKSWFNHSQVYTDDFQSGGVGEIRQGMVYFKGTLWAYEVLDSHKNATSCKDMQSSADCVALQEGGKVKVLEIRDNKVIIQP